MTMPCRNTAALDDYEAAEYRGDELMESYGQEATDNLINLILETRTDDVIEILTNDLCAALEDDESDWYAAVRDQSIDAQGLIMWRATRRAAKSLITELELADEIARLTRD